MRVLAAILCLVAVACTVGPELGDVGPLATRAIGATGTVTIRGAGSVQVELVAVNDTAFIVLTDGAYALVRFSDVSGVDLRPLYRRIEAPRDRYVRNRLRTVSRFPYGLDPAVLASLLRSAGQTELRVLAGR